MKPGDKIPGGVSGYCEKNGINSAVLIGMIGSLKDVELAFLKELPGKYIKRKFYGPLELVSSQGTVARISKDTSQASGERWLHIHITASDENKTVSGHLTEGTVFTTAEVVLGELDEQIERYHDEYTGLKELT